MLNDDRVNPNSDAAPGEMKEGCSTPCWPIADPELASLARAVATFPGIAVRSAGCSAVPAFAPADFYESNIVLECDSLKALESLIHGIGYDVDYAKNALSFADSWVRGAFSMRPGCGEATVSFVLWFAGSPRKRYIEFLNAIHANLVRGPENNMCTEV